jgi:hypothetical protein
MHFRAQAKGGKLEYAPSTLFKLRECLQANEGKWFSIELDKNTRSQSQNAYYWTFLDVIERETGQNANDVHEWAKRRFLPSRHLKVNGLEFKIPGSTTDLDKAAFTEYLDKISAETGVPLPDPEAAGYISNHDKPLK